MKQGIIPREKNHGAVMPSMPDNGYMKVCGQCAARWSIRIYMIGKPRELAFEDCEACVRKKKAARENL